MFVPEGVVLDGSGFVVGPLVGSDPFGDNVEHEKGLEGFEVPGFKQEPFEFRVELTLQSFIPRGKNGNIMFPNGFFKSLQKQSLLNEFS
ncbi:hypothetical protein COLO4_29510 [Corchorus olitorius]|uniref:Uncharacterized protein n=1 Tax=Corchorus olitorius TaxID=93759 RepID=A0A1R3HE77_9ROSI|nr:hypothetical protein COLO4_29510 [Corchorus olitorius]